MRKKRNKENKTVPTTGYIKKYFGDDIGKILIPSNRSLQNCETPYVHHAEAEKVLKDCLIGDPVKDKSLVFTGLTGSGKTTILRHVFGIENNANTPVIDSEKIIIPIDFNRAQASAQDAILSSLRSAVQIITEKYNIDYPDKNNYEFYEYICSKRSDFLCLNPQHNAKTPYDEKMATFLEIMPQPFASCQLQYAMDHDLCGLNLVILIIDNIEAFLSSNARNTKCRYLSPVIEAFKLSDCIDQRGAETKWCFNMVIACRHHIWRIMKGEFTDNCPENALLQSYVTTETPYDLTEPVKVSDIVHKRDEVFSRRQKNASKWDTSVKIINTVLQRMENTIGDFVIQLELKDIRKSMAKIREIILHRGLQKKSDEELASGAFQIDSIDQFDLSRVNLVRIIGLGNRKYYSDLNSTIPNLLYNEQQPGFELYPLLTLKYFLIRCGYTEPAWDNPISIPEFYETMKSIFEYSDEEISSTFKRAVHFLIQHRLLLRSADQPQDEVPGLSSDEIKKIELVYVSGSAIKLWEELGKSSALFQLYIDDVWINSDQSDFFEADGNDIEHCLEYLNELKQMEKKIYNSSLNISERSAGIYLKTFDISPICEQLVLGLISSLQTITISGDSRSQSRIKTAQRTLQKAYSLLQELLVWKQERQQLLISQ